MTKRLSFCAFMSALGAICLTLTIAVPTAKIFFFLFSTLFTYIATEEYGKKYGAAVFIVISAVGFLLLPSKIPVTVYAMSAGYYPVFKHFAEHLNVSFFAKYIIKGIFCTAVIFIMFFVLKNFLTFKFNVLIMILPALILFYIYDAVLSYGIRFYALRLRNKNRL